MTTMTTKNRLARGATVVLVAAAAFAGVVAGPASADVRSGSGAGSVRTLVGPTRLDEATAQQDIPGVERTCRDKYRGWPRNSRVVTADNATKVGPPSTSTAFVDCPPPR